MLTKVVMNCCWFGVVIYYNTLTINSVDLTDNHSKIDFRADLVFSS